ncbi:6,7-dimethyl-8-ribityllumazine synthase [Leucobacter sp. OH2974_COT-288]|uniref:6,7-dimethyl-8-ribityllumazine synthase n=1 Tax=Canibacter oris TaxID=1365628 RepID=A0A840DM15_9MICO|nr:6,7-dimethyl-8-ribityllumazine synthase [Canibacter oris]MBB4071108.1 6,7-dimethyl-8-ribityllumazine synthase [Canibacter oris]RRD35036.1 6,7-dimethyl-8-ribityllumazine synthase [Leucobacter sp. OH2974_COT-288]
MSGQGAPDLTVDASGMKVAIIAGSWHAKYIDAMVEAAVASVAAAGASSELFHVAGSFELPLAAQAAASHYDAVVCLGVIVRGGTPHFDYVCNAVTDGLTRVQLDTKTPIGFGVLTVDNEEQAFARSGLPGSSESKGKEAAEAALHLAVAVQRIAAAQ